MGELVAVRDIKINAVEADDGSLVVTSEGLAARGLPELELVGVAVSRAREAATLINHIAEYSANEKRIDAGERIGIIDTHGSLVARLVASPGAGKVGLGRWFGGGKPRRLRIEEPLEGMAPLKTLLSTVMLWNAAAARENDDLAGAKDILQSAIEFFPGDPARREAPEVGEGYNWENHLAYLRLSELLEGEAASAALAKALARCAVLELERLGDPASELAAATKHLDRLRARAQTVLDTIAGDPRADDEPGMRMAMSPLWRNVDGEVVRRLEILAGPAYSPGPLLANPALVEAAIEWLSSSSPLDVARLSRDTIQFWEGDASEGQLKVLDEPYQAGDFLLSLALAHVARLAAADLTVDEVRAACELVTDGAATEGARNKLAKLEAAETAMLLAAMGLDLAASGRDA